MIGEIMLDLCKYMYIYILKIYSNQCQETLTAPAVCDFVCVLNLLENITVSGMHPWPHQTRPCVFDQLLLVGVYNVADGNASNQHRNPPELTG